MPLPDVPLSLGAAWAEYSARTNQKDELAALTFIAGATIPLLLYGRILSDQHSREDRADAARVLVGMLRELTACVKSAE